jgi:hypothetical protein
MKKLLVLFGILFNMAAMSQTDSSFHKVSVRVNLPALCLPIADKNISTGYGSYFGQEGIGITYRFTPSYSIELWATLDSLPMIDQKDYVKANYTPLYNIYYNYAGGSLQFLALGILFKYNFYIHRKLSFYTLGGPAVFACSKQALTGGDIRIRTNAPVMLMEGASSETVFGFRLGTGSSYTLGKHFSVLAEANLEMAMTSKVNPSSITRLALFTGIEYGF